MLLDDQHAPAQGALTDYALHTLGWKSFQDICVAVAQECLKRPIESFLPSRDGGRDGAFIGRWQEGATNGKSTIQCKFTSKPRATLSLANVKSELNKAQRLAAKGLAEDYVLLTNFGISGDSAAEITAAFEAVGVKKCLLLGRD